eukprot:EG_transcript_3103
MHPKADTGMGKKMFRIRFFAVAMFFFALYTFAPTSLLDGVWMHRIVHRPPSTTHRTRPQLATRAPPAGYQPPPQNAALVEVEVNPKPKFDVATSTTIQCMNGQDFSNNNLVVTDTCEFNTGNLNVKNSTIVFTGIVQFFSVDQQITLDSNSTWTFTNTTTIMVITSWLGTGTFEFTEGSNLTITSSNTLTVGCRTIFKGTIAIGNTLTVLRLNGPSINTGVVYLEDRLSEYICATDPSLGRCVLDGVTVHSSATDLTGWRIVEQLECRGGTMVVNNCTIESQTSLPFELIMLSTPQWTELDVNNVTSAALFCGTKFGATAFSDTTILIVDTTCTCQDNKNWSNVAVPFEPSDGFVIDYGTLVFANVTKASKGLLITNGNFHIDGTSFYVDVKAVDKSSWSLPLLEYNMTQCKTDWDDFIMIENCPTYSTCHWSAATLPTGRCVVYFHYNDWYESNESLWWLLALVAIPVVGCFWVCCCWGRHWQRKRETKMRDAPAPVAELAYGQDNLSGKPVGEAAFHQAGPSEAPQATCIGVPPTTPTSRSVNMNSVFGPPPDLEADPVIRNHPERLQEQQQQQKQQGQWKATKL